MKDVSPPPAIADSIGTLLTFPCNPDLEAGSAPQPRDNVLVENGFISFQNH
jgi:hypothetical protein